MCILCVFTYTVWSHGRGDSRAANRKVIDVEAVGVFYCRGGHKLQAGQCKASRGGLELEGSADCLVQSHCVVAGTDWLRSTVPYKEDPHMFCHDCALS
jgi:hypothetical protein